MDRDELLTRLGGILNRVVKEKVDPASVTENARLLEDLGVGSIEANEMIFEIEDALDLEFQDEEVLRLRGGTVGDVLNLIERKRGPVSGGGDS